ncbi:MAG: glycosyltransferase [Chitinivibrionales bacterium]
MLPFQNTQAHIAESVKSVLRSTYENFELLLIDNCSTDGSVDRPTGRPACLQIPSRICLHNQKSRHYF